MAQMELLSVDTFFMKVTPLPSVATNAGQLTYTLTPGWRSVTRGYTVVPNAFQALYGPYVTPNVPTTEVPVPFNCPLTTDRSQVLTMTFDFDPGNQLIYLDAFFWPNSLTSENISLQIPVAFQSTTLRSRVMMMIEERNFGSSTYWTTQYEKTYRPRWLAYSSMGSQTHSKAVTNARIYG